MSDDLVRKLRTPLAQTEASVDYVSHEAADRIGALELALQKIIDIPCTTASPALMEAWRIAREALDAEQN